MKKFLLTCSALLFAFTLLAQGQTVSGTVTSKEDGSALPGVNVIVKGTTTGGVTDTEGKYTLSGVPADATLVFSFIGLKTSEVSVASRSIVDVPMSMDVTQLT